MKTLTNLKEAIDLMADVKDLALGCAVQTNTGFQAVFTTGYREGIRQDIHECLAKAMNMVDCKEDIFWRHYKRWDYARRDMRASILYDTITAQYKITLTGVPMMSNDVVCIEGAMS